MFFKPTMVLKAVTFLMLSALQLPASAFQIKRVGGGAGLFSACAVM
jgi:succinate-acetate transporter protein